ncbi:hypothetical protein HPB51_026655 [Rhipicephalus microplus]|uniref:Uncharacterized protein n=1 Tax=Rhipicephalus microplus TaxID=6941 RepID=A0A9J6D2G9_RHIMP|nr:hypothetical protein HPB51_026655 [Rhipicephalus microplus]
MGGRRNLEGLIDAVKGLPLLECVSISMLDPESCFERSQQLSQLLVGPGCRSLQQAHFDVPCDLGPMLERLGENEQVVEVYINQQLTTPSELMKLCDLVNANAHLKHLSLPINMDSTLPRRYYKFVLSKFVEKARMEVLNLQNSFITTRGIKAIAEGLKRNGAKEASEPTSAIQTTESDVGRQRYLKALYIRGDLTCEHLGILVDALDANRTLEVLDVGRVLPSPSMSHADVTRKIVDQAFRQVAETLETLEIQVSVPGTYDVAFMGVSLLAATSNSLTELNVTLADSCCEFVSILLLHGLASSISIRSLTMSGWSLKRPVPFWFFRFCRMNESLRKLHIYITNLEADDNTTFYEDLPDALA